MSNIKFAPAQGKHVSTVAPKVNTITSAKKLVGEPSILRNSFVGPYQETKGRFWKWLKTSSI